MPEANHTANTLHEAITSAFDLGELKTLCFDLQVEYDDLPGDNRQEKVRELLRFLERVGRQDELLPRLQQLRPLVPWHSFQPAEPGAASPFKGLHYFDESDAHLFFGREKLTAELVDHLRQHRFLAVVGASGSGKSSLVRAGVIPAIRRGEIKQNDHASSAWPIHLITPGDEPLKALAASLTRDSESVTALKTLLADLRADAENLDLFLYRQMNGQPEGRVLLVVDQFEELFTQCDDPEERRLFVENLVHAVQSGKQGRLSLILTLRADFYAHAVQYEGLRPLLETRQKIVGAMNPDELRRAIEAPAARDNWQFQPGLVETMLQDVGREPGALPLLSHALQETWIRREGRVMTLAGYQAAGGVRRAIAQTADTMYASLTPTQQTIARNIFLRLTELGEGTEDTRRRVTLAELLFQKHKPAKVEEILELLARRRLVTLDKMQAQGSVPQTYIEVAHEALIREWDTLRQWLKQDRDSLRLHRQLTEVTQQWQKADEDPSYLFRGGRLIRAQEWATANWTFMNKAEQRFLRASHQVVVQEETERETQRKRELTQARQLAEAQTRRATVTRRFLWIISLLLVGAVGLAIFAFVQASEAKWQGRLNLAQSLVTLSQFISRDSRGSDDSELATLLAIEAYLINRDEAGNIRLLVDSALRPLFKFLFPSDVLRGHEHAVTSVAFSPDGQTLASGSWDFTIRLWDLSQPGAEPLVLRGHENDVTSVAFSPDGQTLASGSGDSTIRLWDLNQPRAEPAVLRDHENTVTSVAFSSDGQTLASSSFDGTIRLWLLLDELITIGCQQVWRNLTWDEWQRYLPSEPYRQTCPNWPVHPSVPENARPQTTP